MRERPVGPTRGAEAVTSAPEAGGRDPRLDVLRGAALAMIFVNHVPGNAFEALTTRNFGLSDAAEGFVLISGVSAGLAYGPAFRPGAGAAWAGVGRAWRRAWTIYLVHVLVTVSALGIAAGLALWGGNAALLRLHGIDLVLSRPLETLAALPLLLYQLSYANILPLYVVLLLAAPAALWLAWRAPTTLLVASLLLWAVAGELRLNLPLWPAASGGWHFAPPSWQALFVVGLLMGVRMRQGRRLVPARPGLVALAAAILVLGLAWKVIPPVGGLLDRALATLEGVGAPWVLAAVDKTWATAPRLVHALALAYLLSALPAVRRLCASPVAAPLALLGRHALPVFALGSVLAFLLQGIRAGTAPTLGLDALMLGGGLLLQLGLAFASERWPSPARPA